VHPDLIDPLYNIHRDKETIEKEDESGESTSEKVVTSVIVETALPLVITQNQDEAKANNFLFVPESAAIKVSGPMT
jgi:hypothetical protein